MAKELQTDLIGQRVRVLFWKGSDRPGDGTIRAVTYDAKEATFMYAVALDRGEMATLDSRWFTLIDPEMELVEAVGDLLDDEPAEAPQRWRITASPKGGKSEEMEVLVGLYGTARAAAEAYSQNSRVRVRLQGSRGTDEYIDVTKEAK